MDWATLQTELPVLIGDLAEVPCDFRGQARSIHMGTAAAQLDIIAVTPLGVDELTYASSDEGLEATAHGMREMTVQVSIESQLQQLASSSRAVLEKLRLRLRLPTTLERLRALGLAFVRAENTIVLDDSIDGRRISLASMDLHFGFGLAETDEVIPFIETVHVESASIRNTAGDPVGVQFDEVLTLPTEP